MFLIPPAAAGVFTLFYLISDEPRLRSKIIVAGLFLAGLVLQFAGGGLGTWLLDVLINTGVAIHGALYLQFGSP